MILFRQDWELYPNAIADIHTTNKSFLRIAALYRDMGIANHLFPLQLLNPEIQGIDPFSPDLTAEQEMMIAIEAKSNLFYLAREVTRDPNGSYDNPIRFRANRANIGTFWMFLNHITTIIEIGRQQGKSFTGDTISTWLIDLAYTQSSVNLLTKDDGLRAINLMRLKNLINELPDYLNMLGKTDVANTEEIHIKVLDNHYKGMLPNKSPKAALMVGRGGTAPTSFIDEAAFLYNIAISLPAMLAAGTAARDIAKTKYEPYGTLLYTTAGKKDDRDGRYIYNLIQASAIFTERFYDCESEADLIKMIRKNSPSGNLRVYMAFNHRQLGYTDEWLRQVMEAAESTGEDALRDFLGVWTSGSQSSPLSLEILETIRKSECKDYYSEISPVGAYITRWYIDESYIDQYMSRTHCVMSVDTSDAAGGDDLGVTVMDVKTADTVAVGNYNETNLIVFAEWLCQWLVRFPNLTMIIERRSSAATIIDYMLLMLPSLGIDPFVRLFNKVVQEADENKERFKEISKPLHLRSPEIYTKHKKTFGFSTSATGATSRTELYGSTLLRAGKLAGDKVKDATLINQILSLIIRNNRVDHPEGGNDDLCISWLLDIWFIIHGKNLSYYGINARDLLVDNRVNQSENTPEILYMKQQTQAMMNEVEQLSLQLSKEPDDFIAYKLEAKLKLMYSQIPPSISSDILSLEELMNKIKESRQQFRHKRFSYH